MIQLTILSMLASQAFNNNILDKIQSSNLNFQLQVLPFSAHIPLSKSSVKDKEGALLLPPPLQNYTLPWYKADLKDLEVKNLKLENDLFILNMKHAKVVNKCAKANEIIKTLENVQESTNQEKTERISML